MSKPSDQVERIRTFLVQSLDEHPQDIVLVASSKFHCSRQAIHKHLQRLITEGVVTQSGQTRNTRYDLAALTVVQLAYEFPECPPEDEVWRNALAPHLKELPDNGRALWQYGFTEMFNNVIDHSTASRVQIEITRTAATTKISITDNGVGIFKKIQTSLGLDDERHAVLELAKGKFTTDPRHHSGEGVFFSSRMFDEFRILSGHVYYTREFNQAEDWIRQAESPRVGTRVEMVLRNRTGRKLKDVFDRFTTGDDFEFNKTVVPVKLMQYGDDQLISRSQARRLMARFDRFKLVVLDFENVESIGQSFADEVFRVFRRRHPEVELQSIHVTRDVRQMISRAERLGSRDDE